MRMPDEPEKPVTKASGSSALSGWSPQPLIVVVSGPSGAGKDTVIDGLRQRRRSVHFVVTATSRPPRRGERDGVDYHFLSREEFRARLQRGEFLEHDEHFENLYGVLKSELTDSLSLGEDVITRVDVNGARTLRELLPDAVFVFIVAESVDEHLRRIEGRGAENAQELQLRRVRLQEEVSRLPEFDYVVINRSGRLDDAVSTLDSILTAEKARVRQRRQRVGLS